VIVVGLQENFNAVIFPGFGVWSGVLSGDIRVVYLESGVKVEVIPRGITKYFTLG
jgi:hypothetical protein